MTQAPAIVTVGHILEEVIEFPDRTIGPVVGGPAAYAAVAAARLGAQCGIVTVVGSDHSPNLLTPLLQAGVDIQGIAFRGSTRRSILSYDAAGRKRITYTSIAEPIRAADIPATSLSHAAGYLLCPLDFEIDRDLVGIVHSATDMLMIDLGGFGGSVSTRHPIEDARTAAEVRDVVGEVGQVKASLEDCQYLLGSSDPIWSAQQLVRWGAQVALVTCDARGLVHCDRKEARWIPAFQVKALDGTGAGDVFCGAFLAECIRSGDSHTAATYAAAAAALFVTGTGGVSPSRAPTDDQVREMVASGARRS